MPMTNTSGTVMQERHVEAAEQVGGGERADADERPVPERDLAGVAHEHA